VTSAVDELWAVARSGTLVDAAALARAVEEAIEGPAESLDYRTRLLIRDSLTALQAHWGRAGFESWLHRSPHGAALDQLCQSPPMRSAADDEGFPTLKRRIVNAIKPETVVQLLRELSAHVAQPTRLVIGGSIALLLGGHLARHTDDIDMVDELPAALRNQPELLENLAARYGLRLTHFQSHYLPSGWDQRVRSIDVFGKLTVLSVDPYDVFVGKLFSTRDKDRDDLRAVAPQLDRATLSNRLARTTKDLRGEPRLADAAQRNWFILFGEELPA
jgi:hypothetical protein